MKQLEYLDIVSNDDEAIGQLDRESFYQRKLTCFRTVNGFLLNSLDQLWIPIRQSHKPLWPLHMDASVGGHVKSGETYEEAFIREVQEELGLKITSKDIEFIEKLTPSFHKVTSYMKLFLIHTDKTPDFNVEDFISGEWISLYQLKHKFIQKELSKPDLPILIHVLESKLKSKKYV